MGKGAALLGLILIIVGLLPIWATYLSAYIDLSTIVGYFNQNIYSITLGGFLFTEVMLAFIIIGVLLLIYGAAK